MKKYTSFLKKIPSRIISILKVINSILKKYYVVVSVFTFFLGLLGTNILDYYFCPIQENFALKGTLYRSDSTNTKEIIADAEIFIDQVAFGKTRKDGKFILAPIPKGVPKMPIFCSCSDEQPNIYTLYVRLGDLTYSKVIKITKEILNGNPDIVLYLNEFKIVSTESI